MGVTGSTGLFGASSGPPSSQPCLPLSLPKMEPQPSFPDLNHQQFHMRAGPGVQKMAAQGCRVGIRSCRALPSRHTLPRSPMRCPAMPLHVPPHPALPCHVLLTCHAVRRCCPAPNPGASLPCASSYAHAHGISRRAPRWRTRLAHTAVAHTPAHTPGTHAWHTCRGGTHASTHAWHTRTHTLRCTTRAQVPVGDA